MRLQFKASVTEVGITPEVGAILAGLDEPGMHTGHDGGKAIPCPVSDPNAPDEAKAGGHGTSEYYLIHDFLSALENNARPPIDIARSLDFTVPGIITHESALRNGKWLDVPMFD